MTDEVKKVVRKRGPRRNYERELNDVKQFCEVSILILEDLKADETGTGLAVGGKVAAYREVLKRLNGTKKGE